MIKSLIFVFSLFEGASIVAAQVRLNATAQPATAYAGVTSEAITGSGFPSGPISAENVTVTFSTACNGSAAGTVAASTVGMVIGTTRRVYFTIPKSLPGGKYAVSISSSNPVLTTSVCSSVTVNPADQFVHRANREFAFNGLPFRFGGGNSFELMYSDKPTVDQVLQTAVNNKFRVLRTWGWIDIGNADGSNSVRGKANGFYFQYWNGSAPAYNDGPNGLANLDYTIYRAGQLGLKLIIPFTNNWTDFGGMDQYVRWANGQYHDQFYTDPTIRQWYKNWVSHLVNRVNSITGIAYKNDPTIMMWELANEPRCTGSGTSGGGYPSSSSCSTQSIISWIDDVAPYVKSVDPNHMVAVGDEGFFCDPSTTDWITNCSQGVDTIAFSSAPGIDAMGFHLYPEGWGRTTAWADTYINQHIADAGELGKPAYLGEFGLMAGNLRNSIYKDWTDRFLDNRASGALFWDLAVGQPGANSAESDGSFDIKEAAPLLNTIHNFSEEITANTNLPFAPVADDAWATTPFNQSTTLTPLGNDVAYAGATIDPNSIDLDPNTPGRQTSVSVYGGQFQVVGQGVQFTPTAGFNGASQAPYTIEDSNHKLSNVAFLNVTVKPSEGAVLILESFETGTDGWGPINASAGTVSQSTAFHTDGTHSLQVNATGGGWFGVTFASPLDLSGRPSVSIDIESTTIGGGTAIAFQSGSAYTWCQTPDPWPTLPSNGVTTLKLALVANQLNCGGGTPDLTDIHTIFVYLNGPGTFYLDYLRAAAPVISSTPVEIQSFETGTGGWNALHSGDGSVAQESSFHTDGNYGLEINSTSSGGDWFGLNLPSALDLSGKTSIKFDIQTLAQGTSSNVAIQTGANWTWCQGGAWPYTSAGNTTTVAVDFSSLVDTSNNPCNPTLSQIHALWIFFNNGTFNLDNVRAQ